MERVKLQRFESSLQGTFGKIYFKESALFTGELPWADNFNDISCIPAGVYHCRWTYSHHFKKYLYEVFGVSGRAGIRIHSANFMGDAEHLYKKQLNGCIALGEALGQMDGQKAVLLSMPAVRTFESIMNHEPFDLEVINAIS